MKQETSMVRVAVVGRGVIGLSCAVALARAGHPVTVVSRPPSAGETITSEVAAAFWFPYLTAVDPAAGFSEADLARPTLEHFHTLLAEPRAHISLAEGVEYLGTPAGRNGLPHRWWHDEARVRFRTLPPAELPDIPEFGPLEAGCTFVVPVAFMPGYLAFLLDQFRAAGGQEQFLDLGSLDDLDGFDVVVNCAGLDARPLAADAGLTAVRGQVVVVRDVPYPHNRLYFLEQGAAFEREPVYIVPRGRDVVLGGTAELVAPEQASLSSPDAVVPSDEVSARIIRRCALLRPEFAATRQYTAKVGLRPCRIPVRIEWDGKTFRRPVVHCYGHGGAGVTLSWGSALVVRDLVASNVGRQG
jgi:D-amino-acid oxidase